MAADADRAEYCAADAQGDDDATAQRGVINGLVDRAAVVEALILEGVVSEYMGHIALQ